MKQHSFDRSLNALSLSAGDRVSIDGARYTVRAVTETALVRLEDEGGSVETLGAAVFRDRVDDADRIVVERIGVESVSRERFHEALASFASDEPAMAAFVTIPVDGPADYYLYDDGSAGFAVSDGGQLKALFNHDAPKGIGEGLIEVAKDKGATSLFCFDTKLTDIYERHGFVETDRAEWDEEQAPSRWDYERFGQPDVVWMEVDE